MVMQHELTGAHLLVQQNQVKKHLVNCHILVIMIRLKELEFGQMRIITVQFSSIMFRHRKNPGILSQV